MGHSVAACTPIGPHTSLTGLSAANSEPVLRTGRGRWELGDGFSSHPWKSQLLRLSFLCCFPQAPLLQLSGFLRERENMNV